MALSPKNALIAAKKVGLLETGPMHVKDRDERILAAGRLASFLDRMDHLDTLSLESLPKMNSFNPKI